MKDVYNTIPLSINISLYLKDFYDFIDLCLSWTASPSFSDIFSYNLIILITKLKTKQRGDLIQYYAGTWRSNSS